CDRGRVREEGTAPRAPRRAAYDPPLDGILRASMQLQGKVVAVTGAFGALGRAVVDEALAAGAQVAMLGHAHGAQPPDGAAAWPVELTSLADVARVFDEAAQRFGRIDALVNVAGGFGFGTLEQSDDLAEFRTLFETNLL